MAIDANEIIGIMRNVTGRIDSSDPLFSDAIMLRYLNDFLQLIMPQEVRLLENKTWWEFTLSGTVIVDPLPVDLQTLGYSTIGPPVYADGFELEWFQNAEDFFRKWPETQTYTEQRPIDVLYYNQELVFRAPPDQDYDIKMAAYKVELRLTEGTNPADIENDYFWRYAAYGASLDIFSDYGEMENYNKYLQPFQRYKSLVYARTNQQMMSQRAFPNF